MRTLTLTLVMVVGSTVHTADGADSPYSAWKRAHDAARKKDWGRWADTMTPECQRILVVDLVGFFVAAPDEARRAGVSQKKVRQFEQEFESAVDEWVASGTARNLVRSMAKELEHDDYQPSTVDSRRLTSFGRKWDIPTGTADERLECRIFLHILELIGQKRWEQITSGEDLDRNFDEAAFENAMNKAARQLETRTEVVSKSVPDFVTLNLLSDLKQVRKEKRKLGEMYGTLAEVMPDVVRLCGILDLVCEPVFVTESGSVSEFTVEKDRAQVPVALKSLSKKTRHLQFRKVDGVWKIDSLGYGRWLSAQFEPD